MKFLNLKFRNNFVQHTLYEVIRFVIISFSEKSRDTGRKKVEELARTSDIELYSLGDGRVGKHRIYVGVGRNNFVQHTLYEVIRITNISEEEDIEILSGAKISEFKKEIEELDYLESSEIIEFDGILCTENIDEEADFSKIDPYST